MWYHFIPSLPPSLLSLAALPPSLAAHTHSLPCFIACEGYILHTGKSDAIVNMLSC